MCTVCNSLMICGVLVPPMICSKSSVGHSLVLENAPLRCAFAYLPNEFVFFIQHESVLEWHSEELISMYLIMIALLRVATGESRIPRPCFRILQTPFIYCLPHVYLLQYLLHIAITIYKHLYHLPFNISSPN